MGEGSSGSLAARLSLTLQSRQDFAKALELVDSQPDRNYKISCLIHIAKSQVRSDIDPVLVLGKLNKLAEEESPRYNLRIYQGIAEVFIEAGDFESAQSALIKASSLPTDNSFYLDLAKAKAKHGVDPTPELDKVRAEVEGYQAKWLLGFEIYPELAEAHYHATGEYPEEYLSKAEAGIKRYAKKYPNDIHLPGWYGDIAKAYATVGNFERALALFDKIKGYDPINEAQTRMRALKDIAKKQVARGLYKEAIVSAMLAIETIQQAEPSPEHLRIHLEWDQKLRVIELLALIAKARGLGGEDSSETFKSALGMVTPERLGGYWESDVLTEIARAQRDVGIDPTPTLARALAELDAWPQLPGYDETDSIYQQMGYRNLARAQAEFGLISGAKDTLQHLQNVSSYDYIIESMVAEVLADIAEAEARQGLSEE